ncbi:hypothetical protein ACJ72_07064 [Emergomyces africanus]|uniref:CBS domain-containing protein n=1 Tax=Emergomyces africanus TaxID=1955775 RepID=A0A1B7NPC6_9EURO|nr:hypothetical protein ACJ72_07064 [Emergomyces africanus]
MPPPDPIVAPAFGWSWSSFGWREEVEIQFVAQPVEGGAGEDDAGGSGVWETGDGRVEEGEKKDGQDVVADVYARQLIAEEGLLVGGSSGSAIAGLVKAAKDFDFTEDDVIVVVLPDSIRSYLTKFADDDWLAANDLLPEIPPTTEPPSPEVQPRGAKDPFSGAKVKALRLKPVTTVLSNSTCEAAIEVMREKNFDQLPVLAPTGKRLVGLVTLGNILSRVSHGRATSSSPVSDVMFDFSKLSEIVTDPRDISRSAPELRAGSTGASQSGPPAEARRQFIEITLDTPLSALNRFFEWNSAAVVTEKDQHGVMKPVAVVTKVDLLTWLLHQSKVQA